MSRYFRSASRRAFSALTNVGWPLASLPFDADFPVPIEDDFWVRLLRMPEPFQVCSLDETGRCLKITILQTRNQPAARKKPAPQTRSISEQFFHQREARGLMGT